MAVIAHSDLFLPFAPGAQISKLKFEIAVNGSAGYWANESSNNSDGYSVPNSRLERLRRPRATE